MKKVLISILMVGLIIGFTGCCNFMPSNVASQAAIVMNQRTSAPFVDNSVKPESKGISRACGVIIYSSGDSSIKAAMADGNIEKVHHIDYEIKNILWLYNEIQTIVWGECYKPKK